MKYFGLFFLCLMIASCIDNNFGKEDATSKSASVTRKGRKVKISGNEVFQLQNTITQDVPEDTTENDYKLRWPDDYYSDFISREDYISLVKDLVEAYRKEGRNLDSAIIELSDKGYNITADSIKKWWNEIR